MRVFIWVVIVLLCAAWVFTISRELHRAGDDMSNKLKAEHFAGKENNRPLGGTTTGPGLSVSWKGDNAQFGAEPIDLVEAALDRVKHLQTTAAGGDPVARQIWALEQCAQELRKIEAANAPRTAPGVGSGAGFGGTVEKE